MVTGERASLLCLHSSPPCLWGLWMDLAELLRCWGHRQGGCESSDPKVCAVWAKHLVGRTVPIGTSAALGEVPSVRIPMDYTRDAAGRKAWASHPSAPQANMDVDRVSRCVHHTVHVVSLPISWRYSNPSGPKAVLRKSFRSF